MLTTYSSPTTQLATHPAQTATHPVRRWLHQRWLDQHSIPSFILGRMPELSASPMRSYLCPKFGCCDLASPRCIQAYLRSRVPDHRFSSTPPCSKKNLQIRTASTTMQGGNDSGLMQDHNGTGTCNLVQGVSRTIHSPAQGANCLYQTNPPATTTCPSPAFRIPHITRPLPHHPAAPELSTNLSAAHPKLSTPISSIIDLASGHIVRRVNPPKP